MPDIHWHIGEDAEQETIATTTSSRRSRRSWVVILMVVVIGAVLGAVYRTIPEPAPWPTPLPAPTPQPTPMRPAIPAKLYEVIDREAQALADGDVDIYLALHAFQDPQTIAWLRSNFAAWSRQTDDRPLYAIIDFNLRPQTKAWADIRQFRKGRWFREMRFYRWYEDRWLRSDPDALYWSGQTGTLDTAHFHVIYFVEDQEFIQPITDQLKKVQGSLCAALGCDATPLTYTLKLDSSIAYDWPFFDDEREIRFVSPRIFGVYEDDTPLDEEGGLNWIWMMAWTSAYRSWPMDRPQPLLANAPVMRCSGRSAIGRPCALLNRPISNRWPNSKPDLQHSLCPWRHCGASLQKAIIQPSMTWPMRQSTSSNKNTAPSQFPNC